MKTIGIIGGMSWESTHHYYQVMNQYVHAKLGGHNSIESIIYSVNFEPILQLVNQNDWERIGKKIAELAKKLEDARADFIIMTSNTIHKVCPMVEQRIHIPILHIVDPTGDAIQKSGISTVGLLGTKVTMEEDFYKKRLEDRYGIKVLIPKNEEREVLNRIIFEELTIGLIHENSRKKGLSMIANLMNAGADGVILGCTELTLLLTQKDTHVPLFDTTDLHAKAAVDAAILK